MMENPIIKYRKLCDPRNILPQDLSENDKPGPLDLDIWIHVYVFELCCQRGLLDHKIWSAVYNSYYFITQLILYEAK